MVIEMYFKNFPTMYYEFDIGGSKELKIVTDITQNVRVLSSILENITLYDEYDIMDGDTPDIVAAKIYGSSVYHWIIMLINQRFDYVNDWPMTEKQLDEYVKNQYGSKLYDTKHYINDQGYVINSSEIGATPVTNYDYEKAINENKRRIKLISPAMLARIVSQFNSLIKNNE